MAAADRGPGGKHRKCTPASSASSSRRILHSKGIAIDHRWSGKVTVTLDQLPHVGRASPRVAYAIGYGGRGVVLTNLLGMILAQLAMGETPDGGPMTDAALRRVPLQRLRIPAMKAVASHYGLLDRLTL